MSILNNQVFQLTQEEMNEQQLTNNLFIICINPSTNCFSIN
jgi:hypothetical protein